ncbi:MAG: CinA family protein [Planctomycetales bacterium]|nr:CinA family protein [Planctomycetales bacterium]
MNESGLQLAVAESLTGGQLQSMISSASGASNYFRGGVTAYCLDAKVKLLGVHEAHAREVNCVSERVAAEMAAGVRQLFDAQIGLATTGYAEPSPEWNISQPMAYFAISILDRKLQGIVEGGSRNRVEMQLYTAGCVLSVLCDALRGIT